LDSALQEIKLIDKKAIGVKADVRLIGDAEQIVEMAVKTFDRLDILINNAGLTNIAPFLETTEENWDLIVDTILKGTFLCSKAAAREMIPQRAGSIVNISSMFGIQGWPEREPYGAAKAGVNNLTRALAAELGPYGIRVNCVAPGYVMTEQIKELIDNGKLDCPSLLKGIPIGRFGAPEDIAYSVLFLSSEKSSFVTGEIFVVDGGWTSSGAAWQVFPSIMVAQDKKDNNQNNENH
jgi:3-oxoacyl-[acyl-carrier protein] reductase